MKDGFNLKTLFPNHDDPYLQWFKYIGDRIILSVFTIFICLVGLVGNGTIIWLLGFRMERKPFAIYILNLAAADFGCLLFLFSLDICFNSPSIHRYFDIPRVPQWLLTNSFLVMFSSSQFLLTAISVDRWVWALFPNWYRSHRSSAWSTVVCVSMWVLSVGFNGLHLFLTFHDLMPEHYGAVIFLGFTVICLSLATISTLTLFIKVSFQSPPCQCGNLLKAILLLLPAFLLFTILTNLCIFTEFFSTFEYIILWASLKSSINPLTYFLSERWNVGKFQGRMKAVFQRVFKEEQDPRMELQPRTQALL